MKTLIIGGGIIGLSCAYYLQREGREVVVFDKGDLQTGCSYGNAGMIVPSHFIPLAAPGMIAKGIRWMFDAQSPFYIKPRLDRDLLSWGWKFYRASSRKKMEKAMPLLRDFHLLSKHLYQDWKKEMDFSFSFTENGLLILCREEHSMEEENRTAILANKMGIEAKILSQKGLRQMEPLVAEGVIGAVFYPGDAHLSPGLLMEGLKKTLRQKGVVLNAHTEVKDFEKKNGRLTAVITDKGKWEAEEVVIASGSWSSLLLKKLGLSLPLQAGKGYSVTIDKPPAITKYPAIFAEAKVAATPFGERMRFGGTMEFAGIDQRISPARVRGILQSIPQYYKNYEAATLAKENVWVGLRPCTPDGLPYLGRIASYSNLTIASGHAMMGLSLAPATGLLISQLICGKKLSLDLDLGNPQRYICS